MLLSNDLTRLSSHSLKTPETCSVTHTRVTWFMNNQTSACLWSQHINLSWPQRSNYKHNSVQAVRYDDVQVSPLGKMFWKQSKWWRRRRRRIKQCMKSRALLKSDKLQPVQTKHKLISTPPWTPWERPKPNKQLTVTVRTVSSRPAFSVNMNISHTEERKRGKTRGTEEEGKYEGGKRGRRGNGREEWMKRRRWERKE